MSPRSGETPAKVREDLEKSLTELNNLSLSICNSEVSQIDVFVGVLPLADLPDMDKDTKA